MKLAEVGQWYHYGGFGRNRARERIEIPFRELVSKVTWGREEYSKDHILNRTFV